ncbi:phenylalanine--tRNA ligase subunit beta [uncultured Flavobacterium sp.]|uniref:phenylalanine--tRNA ligase subunit beta n=1 Tax=uncultured Flavobacterium sp. TaxID=165435 RepID=UPI0030C7E74D
MRISYNWLKQFIKIDWESEETAALLTDLGLEVEGVDKFESLKGGLEGIVVGHVLTCEKHPDADKLKITTVDLGDGNAPVQIVCGAPNVAAGQKVPIATIGTKLYDKEGNAFEIKKGKIRGQESHGMICAEDELGLGEGHDGILILNEDLKPGTLGKDVFNIESDEVFEIGLTPNRADAMSHWGVARDLKAGLIQSNVTSELITPSVSSFNVDRRTLKIAIEVENKELVPRYCGVTISGVTVKTSPSWLQNRLKAIGLSPKNNIVDVTNYVMHELGQPTHAFDANKIKGNKVIVKTVKAGTKFTTLDGVERELDAEDVMICNAESPMCIAGVFGGIESGVTEHTTNIFLESAYFNPVSVRKTAKRHGLNTDASFRFERGIDPSITEYALKRAALLIQEVAGGEITSDITDVYPKKIEDFSVFVTFDRINKVIGEELKKETIKTILTSLEIKINNITESGLGLTIPSYRVDVQREIDVIEEILRVYGYNSIGFNTKVSATIANSPRTEEYKVQNIISDQLCSQGFNEMMANSLTSPDYIKLSEQLTENETVHIINPLSTELSAMRQSLLFSGLEAISFNINRKKSNLRLFEFGKTYHKVENGYDERKHLCLYLTGNKTAENWNTTATKSDFFMIKGYVMALLTRIGLDQKVSTLPVENDVFSEGLALAIGRETIAEFGIVKKSIGKSFDIKQEVVYADINWAAIQKYVSNKLKLTEISKFPEVRRDLALLIDKEVTFEALYKIAKQTDKTLIKEISLFDVYEGKNLPENKKSYAMSFIMSDDKKTLEDKQIEKVMQKLQANFEKEVGATLR